MASPLSPTTSSNLNAFQASTPTPPPRQYDIYEVEQYTATTSTRSHRTNSFDSYGSIDYDESDEGNSSPFMSHVKDDQENAPPIRIRPVSRVMSGSELSPLKLLSSERPPSIRSSLGDNKIDLSMPPPPARSPRKISSPEKRFPVRVSAFGTSISSATSSTSTAPASAVTTPPEEMPTSQEQSSPQGRPRQLSLEDAVRENEGLKHAIDIYEDNVSVHDGSQDFKDEGDTLGAETHEKEYAQSHSRRDSQEDLQDQDHEQHHQQHERASVDGGHHDEPAAMDDTMISNFSDFSIMPNVTQLAMMHSANPTLSKFSTYGGLTTPRAPALGRPNDASISMRTPRANGPVPDRAAQYGSGNSTNLLDFTENLRVGPYQQQQSTSPSRRSGRTSPFKNGGTMPAQTPQRSGNLVSLLDFDLPPMPTPRSMPSITPRELESLKSGFLSEISSLRASLSGKEAEVLSLKTAVGDAEGRVGECMEQLRDLQSQTESLTAEKDSWEKRGREMEAVLRQVKEEIVRGRREREELEARLDEAEKRRDAAETMAQEAESKMAGMRAGKASAEAAVAAGTPVKSPSAGSNKEVELAVERVARELHALYKSKHETKVAALKKSYENRWEKKVRELEAKIEDLTHENEEMRIGRDATMTRVDFAAASRMREELEEERKADRRRHAELEAEVEKLQAVVRTVRQDNEDIRSELERERVEKGELVQLAEEMMNMQTMQSFIAGEDNNNHAPTPGGRHSNPNPPQSVGRPTQMSGRPPSTGSATPAPAPRMNATPSKSLAGRIPASPSGGELGWKSGHAGGGGMPRPTGLRAPVSRIGKGVGSAHGRNGSTVSSGVPRPGSGLGMSRPTGLMSSIEKMGSYRGRD